jgi:hypothetical protein
MPCCWQCRAAGDVVLLTILLTAALLEAGGDAIIPGVTRRHRRRGPGFGLSTGS